MNFFKNWQKKAKELRKDIFALYLSLKDRLVPWLSKFLLAFIVAYAFSPIDLVPDFVPVLGWLDDLVIIPLGVVLARGLVPKFVLLECRQKAAVLMRGKKRQSWFGGLIVITIWAILALIILRKIITVSQ